MPKSAKARRVQAQSGSREAIGLTARERGREEVAVSLGVEQRFLLDGRRAEGRWTARACSPPHPNPALPTMTAQAQQIPIPRT
jgi:hypothetical protein